LWRSALPLEKNIPSSLCSEVLILHLACKTLTKSFQMPPYDSDSSGDVDNDYTLTNVLLGYATKEAKDDEVSQLGGRPVCPDISSCGF